MSSSRCATQNTGAQPLGVPDFDLDGETTTRLKAQISARGILV